ncbi:regulatory protein NPR3-like [Folsomia candida]|uniref:regulatory protein NPR3-like n=1 Tax=Folsomia candida TaxID=158441 RepID=UPI001604F783|nr:regulatory protein NPR3-like [Folsomia candida]
MTYQDTLRRVALTSKGELYQWKLRDKVPQKVLGSVPFKKITGSCDYIFALTGEGELHYLDVDIPSCSCGSPIIKRLFEDHKIEDIAPSCSGTEDVVVVELKNRTRFVFSYCHKDDPNCYPYPLFNILTLPRTDASMEELYFQYGEISYRTISAQIEPPPRRRVSDDICNLWENKKHVDVTFSVEGKSITANKCILAGRSEYFEIMFSKEWNEEKGGSSTIMVKDTRHDIFEALLFYIYSDKVKFQEDEYENIFDLMKLADSYCEVSIRHECEKILISNINEENASFFARNASSANALTLEEKVIKFIVDNQLLAGNSSPQEMIDSVGLDAFQKISVSLPHQ